MKWLRRHITPQKRKRLVLWGVLFIVGGAIINVAVAWKFARFADLPLPNPNAAAVRENLHWPTVPPATFPNNPMSVECLESVGLRRCDWTAIRMSAQEKQKAIQFLESYRDAYSAAPPSAARDEGLRATKQQLEFALASPEGDTGTFSLCQIQAGWPVLSITGFRWFELDSRGQRQNEGSRLSIVVSTPPTSSGQPLFAVQRERLLPLRALWDGFAINTIFYAAILGMLFTAPGFVRRCIHGWRRRCTGCGYDLRGQVVGDSGNIRCPECGVPVKRQ